jgi:hypothetical protein
MDKELEQQVARHSYQDMKDWWKHLAKSLGHMIAAGADEHPRELKAYHKKLMKFWMMAELMILRYTNADTKHELRLLHYKAHRLADHVQKMIEEASRVTPSSTEFYDEYAGEEERVESKIVTPTETAPAPIGHWVNGHFVREHHHQQRGRRGKW